MESEPPEPWQADPAVPGSEASQEPSACREKALFTVSVTEAASSVCKVILSVACIDAGNRMTIVT